MGLGRINGLPGHCRNGSLGMAKGARRGRGEGKPRLEQRHWSLSKESPVATAIVKGPYLAGFSDHTGS